MKLKIEYAMDKIDVLGKSEVLDFHEVGDRIVYIDNKRVPKALADIILLGLDVATEQHLDSLFKKYPDMDRNDI
jgi:hypothetical protein